MQGQKKPLMQMIPPPQGEKQHGKSKNRQNNGKILLNAAVIIVTFLRRRKQTGRLPDLRHLRIRYGVADHAVFRRVRYVQLHLSDIVVLPV